MLRGTAIRRRQIGGGHAFGGKTLRHEALGSTAPRAQALVESDDQALGLFAITR
jgi:hypothetical protein